MFGVAGSDQVVAGPDEVAFAQRERVEAQAPGQLVQCGLDGEGDLPEPVAPEGPGRHGVGVDGAGVGPLVGAPVEGHRLAAAVEEHAGAVVAVGAGVGHHVQLQRGEGAVVAGPGRDGDGERVAGGGGGELLGAGELEADRGARPQHREGHHVLDEHLLFAAETAAEPGRDDADPVRGQVEQRAQRAAGQERRLGAGPDHQSLRAGGGIGVEPADRAVGLQARVLHAPGVEGVLVHRVRRPQSGVDVADPGVQLGHHVVPWPGDPAGHGVLVVHDGRAGCGGGFRVGHGGQHLVGHGEAAAALLGGGHGVGDHGGDALADVSNDVVEQPGVGGVVVDGFVQGGGVQPGWRVLVGEHQAHAGNPERLVGVDRQDAGVGVRGAQQLHVQQSGHVQVQGVAGRPRHDPRSGRCPGASTDGRPGLGAFDVPDAAQRVLDGPVAGAAAQVALEQAAQLLRWGSREPGGGVQAGGGHDEPGGAEAALEPLRVEEPPLDRVGVPVARQALDRGDPPTDGAERREHARVHRNPVHVHGAGSAVAGVAPLPHPE